MIIEKGEIRNFRNIDDVKINFCPEVNIIIGKNGSGKSSILEAISVISNIRSFRNATDYEMIQWEKSGYYIGFDVLRSGLDQFQIGCVNEGGKVRKKIKIGNNEITRAADYYGSVLSIVFSPDDLIIINGLPEVRRRYFDAIISKSDKQYFTTLAYYKKIVSSRNKLLKELRFSGSCFGKIEKKEIDSWNELLAKSIKLIVDKRINFVPTFSDVYKESYSRIADKNENSHISYYSVYNGMSESEILNEIESNVSNDIKYGSTMKGPHRDDFSILWNDNLPVASYASQGQKRTTAIALKTAEKNYIENETGERTILLIDDVFSELDSERKENLLYFIREGNQVIFSMVDIDNELLNSFDKTKVFTAENGKVREG
jgi:DNA replication and repair protein RecF